MSSFEVIKGGPPKSPPVAGRNNKPGLNRVNSEMMVEFYFILFYYLTSTMYAFGFRCEIGP